MVGWLGDREGRLNLFPMAVCGQWPCIIPLIAILIWIENGILEVSEIANIMKIC
jgi:hypothetical protein